MFNKTKKYAVIGSGSWATALVKILLDTQKEVFWYVRDRQVIQHIIENKHNPQYLQAAKLDPLRLRMSADINKTVREADVLIFCIPSVYFITEMMHLNESLKEIYSKRHQRAYSGT